MLSPSRNEVSFRGERGRTQLASHAGFGEERMGETRGIPVGPPNFSPKQVTEKDPDLSRLLLFSVKKLGKRDTVFFFGPCAPSPIPASAGRKDRGRSVWPALGSSGQGLVARRKRLDVGVQRFEKGERNERNSL